MNCSACSKPASGNFCQHCGAPLGGRFCNQCGAALPEGGSFCNQCGAPRAGGGGVGSASSPGGGPPAGTAPGRAAGPGALPWWIAGGAMFALVLVLGWFAVDRSAPAATGAAVGVGGGGEAATGAAVTDISNMTPREAADRLFDRVMRTISAGDTAGALAFQPMGVQAYERAEPLDLDGIFHKAMLELLADPGAALASAGRILEEEPGHVLGLGIAGEAAAAAGDAEGAAGHYRRLLEAYEAQAARSTPEYDAHRNLLESYRAQADAFLAGAGAPP